MAEPQKEFMDRQTPPPSPVIAMQDDGYLLLQMQEQLARANWASWQSRAHLAAGSGKFEVTGSAEAEFVPSSSLPVLLAQTCIEVLRKVPEGEIIRAVTFPLRQIVEMLSNDFNQVFQIDYRKWEEIVAETYMASKLYDEVTLTPRTGDGGRDIIAVKHGWWSLRVIESVKRYKPGLEVTADEVRSLLGVLAGEAKTSKGVISTTWEFAPKIKENLLIQQYVPSRLELINGTALLQRMKACLNT
jgi:restriction system protein